MTEREKLLELIARGIAMNGFGREWDDFEDVNAYDTDHGDLFEYAEAALTAIEAHGNCVVPKEPTRLMDGEGAFVRDEAGSNYAIYRAMLAASPYTPSDEPASPT